MEDGDLIELKFRLADGKDIGPSMYSPAITVASLKEKILAQWPKGHSLSVESRLVNCLELSQLCTFLFVLLCRRKRLRNSLLILRRHPGVDVQSYSRLDKVKRNICSCIPIRCLRECIQA